MLPGKTQARLEAVALHADLPDILSPDSSSAALVHAYSAAQAQTYTLPNCVEG